MHDTKLELKRMGAEHKFQMQGINCFIKSIQDLLNLIFLQQTGHKKLVIGDIFY